MPIRAVTQDGRVLLSPLMSAQDWRSIRKDSRAGETELIVGGVLGHTVERQGLRYFARNPGQSGGDIGPDESMDSIRALSEVVAGAVSAGWRVEDGGLKSPLDYAVKLLPPESVEKTCPAVGVSTWLDAGKYAPLGVVKQIKKVAEAGVTDTQLRLIRPAAKKNTKPHEIPYGAAVAVLASSDVCVLADVNRLLRDHVRDTLNALVKQHTKGRYGLDDDIDVPKPPKPTADPEIEKMAAILTYDAAVDALETQSFGKPSDDSLRGWVIQSSDRDIAWGATPKAQRDSYREVLNLVHVGLHTNKAAKECLERILNAPPEEDHDDREDDYIPEAKRKTRAGDCALCSFVANTNGIIETDSFKLTTFAASLLAMRDGEMAPDSARLDAVFLESEMYFNDKYAGSVASPDVIAHLHNWIRNRLGSRSPELSQQPARVVQFQIPRKGKDKDDDRKKRIEESVPRMAPFFLADIQMARKALLNGDLEDTPLKAFLSPTPLPDSERTDSRSAGVIASAGRVPVAGKWLSGAAEGGPVMAWQQRIVAAEVAAAKQGSLLACCGSPGSGKTFLIKEVVGSALVRRAEAMARFDDPLDAFEKLGEVTMTSGRESGQRHKVWSVAEGIGEGILVCSANNAAVENVVKELGSTSSLGAGWDADAAQYLPDIAQRARNNPKAKIPDHLKVPTWGLVSAVLGKRSNVRDFRKALLSEYETLEDCIVHRMFKKEDVLNGPHSGEPRVGTQARVTLSDGRKIECYLEFTGKELAAEAERMRYRLPWKVTIRGAARAINSDKVEARYDVAEVNPPATSKYLKDCLVGGLHLGGEGAAQALRDWHAARDDFQDILSELRNLPTPPDAEPADVALTADEYAVFCDTVRAKTPVSVRALTAAQLYEADHLGTETRVSELAQLDLGDADRLSEQLTVSAFRLRQAFLVRAGSRILDNLRVWQTDDQYVFVGDSADLTTATWHTFHLVTPVCSSTLASVGRLFAGLGPGTIGDVIVDEAGQAAPHLVVGALCRAQRALIVGDPLQIEPVVTMPDAVSTLLAHHAKLPSDDFLIGSRTGTSAQTLADRVSPLGSTISGVRVGMPLTINRRNAPPMLAVCNKIAYDGMIVSGAPERKPGPGIGAHGCSWIDVTDATDAAKNRIPAQERIILDMLLQAVRDKTDVRPDGLPNWFVISPFVSVSAGIRKCIRDYSHLIMEANPEIKQEAIDAWTANRAGFQGTVHTFQGQEAPVVILALGGNPDNKGAIAWAGDKVNLLNVAVSRAQRALHIVGDRDLWCEHGGILGALAADQPLGALYPTVSVAPGSTLDFSQPEWRPVEAVPYVLPEGFVVVGDDQDDLEAAQEQQAALTGMGRITIPTPTPTFGGRFPARPTPPLMARSPRVILPQPPTGTDSVSTTPTVRTPSRLPTLPSGRGRSR